MNAQEIDRELAQCEDCRSARKHSYSERSTPGFMKPYCLKHSDSKYVGYFCKICKMTSAAPNAECINSLCEIGRPNYIRRESERNSISQNQNLQTTSPLVAIYDKHGRWDESETHDARDTIERLTRELSEVTTLKNAAFAKYGIEACGGCLNDAEFDRQSDLEMADHRATAAENQIVRHNTTFEAIEKIHEPWALNLAYCNDCRTNLPCKTLKEIHEMRKRIASDSGQ